MTHLTPGGARSSAPPTTLGALSADLRELRTTPRRLDIAHLQSGIAAQRHKLATLEGEMVAACEAAAARRMAPGVRLDDRGTWDRPMWQRYLYAAVRLESDYGPPMRKLLQDIDWLQRLTALPLAA